MRRCVRRTLELHSTGLPAGQAAVESSASEMIHMLSLLLGLEVAVTDCWPEPEPQFISAEERWKEVAVWVNFIIELQVRGAPLGEARGRSDRRMRNRS